MTSSPEAGHEPPVPDPVALAPAADDRSTVPDPGEGLRAAVALRQLADRMEADNVEQALAAGWSWSQIAEALNVSRQAVHKKHFSRLERSGTIMRKRRKRV